MLIQNRSSLITPLSRNFFSLYSIKIANKIDCVYFIFSIYYFHSSSKLIMMKYYIDYRFSDLGNLYNIAQLNKYNCREYLHLSLCQQDYYQTS